MNGQSERTIPRPHRGWSALVVALTLIAVLAACGDDADDEEAAEEPATEEPAEELTGPPIRIMTIGEFSAGVSNPEIPEGVEGAVAGINSRGGINGSPVEFEACDTNNDPNTAAECGRKAVDDEVAAVVGGLSIHGSEYLPLLVDNEIPMIGNVLASAADFTSEASFPIYGGIVMASAGLPYALAESGAERIATARIDIAEGAVIPIFGNSALGNLGLEYVADIPIPTGTPDMAPYAAQAEEADPDGIVVAVPGQDSLNFLTEMLQVNPDIKAAFTTTTEDEVREALGDEVADRLAYVEPLVVDADSDAYQQYLADMEAAGFDEVGDFRLAMYAATMVFAEVAATLPEGEVTAPAVWEALPTQTAVTTGLTPPIDFSQTAEVPGSPIPDLRVFNLCTQIAVVEDDVATLRPGFIDPFTGEDCPSP